MNPIVKQVIEEMEQSLDSDKILTVKGEKLFNRWIGMLQASQLVDTPPKTNTDLLIKQGCNPHGPQQAEAKRLERRSQMEEGGPLHVYVKGGSLDGDMLAIDSKMPLGAKTLLNGEVYIRGEDRQLHYSEEDTQEVKQLREGK